MKRGTGNGEKVEGGGLREEAGEGEGEGRKEGKVEGTVKRGGWEDRRKERERGQ